MLVGVPREVKDHEYRVAITPAGVNEFTRHGHEVVVQAGAGVGSSIPDDDFSAAGARVVPTAEQVWQQSDLVLKVKEPMPSEYALMREGQVLFTFLHLAASQQCTQALLDNRNDFALEYLTVAVNLDPTRAEAFNNLAMVYDRLQRPDDAIAAYRSVIAQAPHEGTSWWSLANLKTVKFSDADIAQMEGGLANPQSPLINRIRLSFALGKAF